MLSWGLAEGNAFRRLLGNRHATARSVFRVTQHCCRMSLRPGKGCHFLENCSRCGDKKCVSNPQYPQIDEIAQLTLDSMSSDSHVCNMLAAMVAEDSADAQAPWNFRISKAQDLKGLVKQPRRKLLDTSSVRFV